MLCLLAWAVPVGAGELEDLAISDEAGAYHLSLKMRLEVPAEQVHAVLTDYRRIYRLNPSIIESRLLPEPDGTAARVFTRMQGCVGFFCREFSRVEDVWERPSGEIETRIVPEMSDFDSGVAYWRVQGRGDGTELSYEATLEPAFFVPPLVGGFFVKQKFKQETLLSFDKIECIARVRSALEQSSGMRNYARAPSADPC